MPTVLFLLVDLEQSNGCVVPNWGVVIPRGCQSTGKLVSIKLGLIPSQWYGKLDWKWQCTEHSPSLIPRPFLAPVFIALQCTKTGSKEVMGMELPTVHLVSSPDPTRAERVW